MPARIVVKPATTGHPPRSRRGDLVLLRQGVDIALEYFNSDDPAKISTLTTRARKWADRYFRGYRYASKRPTALLGTFPNLFNLRVQGHLRLAPAAMPSPPRSPEPEGASPRALRRAERKAMNTEAFPEFAEPTLASEDELDEIVNLRARHQPAATKPAMRVDAAALRSSGLMRTLPEFLGQLARANLETETALANNPDAVRLELDDDQAAGQPHVEMNLFTGLVETQRRRHQRRIILPGGRPFKLPGDDDGDDDESGGEGGSKGGSRSSADEDSGDESDASTSTIASLRAGLRKRKAAASDDGRDISPPNKIRLQYQYPPLELRRYDMKRRKLMAVANPDAVPDDPFEAFHEAQEMSGPPSPTLSASSASSTGSSSSSSSGGPTRIIKIRISSSPDSSRASSPDSQGSKVIVLRDPRASPPSDAGASSDRSSPSQRIKLKVPKNAKADGGAPSSSNTESRGGTPAPQTSSPGPASSDGSPAASSASSRRCVKIKVVQRSRHDAGPAKKKRLIEEVDE